MKIKALILVLILPLLLGAYSFNVQSPVVVRNSIELDLPVNMIPGQPELPYIPVRLLVPMGEKVMSVNVDFGMNANVIDNVELKHVDAQQPLSGAFTVNSDRDEVLYNTDSFFPEQRFNVLGTQRSKGYDILLINVYPYTYNPVSHQLKWIDSFEVNVETEQSRALSTEQNAMLLNDSETRDRIRQIVHNDNEITSYQKGNVSCGRTLVNAAEPFDMIIITDDIRAPWFNEFVEWKNDQGISTEIFLTTDIYLNYTGDDFQDMIRAFILDAYVTYSVTDTPLKYVILGGDDEIIPIRKVYGEVGNTIDYTMPSDLYYSNLDGNWDADSDGIYGEVNDDVDMYPEIAIGRIPAEDEFEFQNFFNKNYYYVDNVSVSDDMALMIGENLNNNPLTWGGDYKDEIVPIIDDGIHIAKLYDRLNNFNSENVKDAINMGVSIINHMGHSNETIVFGQGSSAAHNYTNTEYGFAYSQGCYPAAFDEATSGSAESVAENMVISSGGLYCFVGNTRYGWYAPGSTHGASQYYDIEFFQGIYDEGLRELGNALQYSREQLVSEALGSGVMRWVFYEMVCFGDPSISVKETNGTFPFIQPLNSSYEDLQGDHDSIANPGETINLFVTLENLEGWADAEDVYAKITFEDESMAVLQDSVYYGSIANGQSLETGSFVVNVPQECVYGEYKYMLEVFAPVSRNQGFNKTYTLGFDVSLNQANWPYSSTIPFNSNPMIVDFNQDEQRDILALDVFANSYLLNNDAQLVDGYQWDIDEEIWRSAAYGDINEDGSKDLVVACKTGKIYAVDNDGNTIFSFDECLQQILTPIICNIIGDETPEIISFGIDKKIIALDSNGNLISGFPVELANIGISEMAAADINIDGYSEIIIGTQTGELYGISGDGEILDGFPVDLGFPICASPVILDNKNIVLGTCNSKLFIISPAGDILLEKDLVDKIAGSSILANFDEDIDLEIGFVTSNGSACIINQDGTELPGWPVELDTQFSNSPLAADINGDELVDLLCLSFANELYILRPNGEEFAFSPVPANLSGNTPASIDDVDGDYDYEVISGCSKGLFALDIKLHKGNDIPWRTYRGNYQRTGYFGDNDILSSNENTTPDFVNNLYQNYPNPFNPTTRISFSLDKKVDYAEIEIFNIKGQKIKTIGIDPSPNKIQEVIWSGRDKNNHSVASGIYFYQLKADGKFIESKKCILIK